MTIKENMEDYITTLEVSNEHNAQRLCEAVARIAKGVTGLDTTEERIAALKGFEPKYDRLVAKLEARRDTIRDLKKILEDSYTPDYAKQAEIKQKLDEIKAANREASECS